MASSALLVEEAALSSTFGHSDALWCGNDTRLLFKFALPPSPSPVGVESAMFWWYPLSESEGDIELYGVHNAWATFSSWNITLEAVHTTRAMSHGPWLSLDVSEFVQHRYALSDESVSFLFSCGASSSVQLHSRATDASKAAQLFIVPVSPTPAGPHRRLLQTSSFPSQLLDDTFVFEAQPTFNYGTMDICQCSEYAGISSLTRMPMFKFQLPITAAPVQSAFLQFQAAIVPPFANASVPIRVHSMYTAWSETNVSLALLDPAGIDSIPIGSTRASTTLGTISANVTAYVAAFPPGTVVAFLVGVCTDTTRYNSNAQTFRQLHHLPTV